jgi:hypothetical protein
MADRMRLIWAGLVELWCSWTHGGGHIERDPLGRVNWQCNKCGRWADPVSLADERAMTDAHVSGVEEGAGQSPAPSHVDGGKQ